MFNADPPLGWVAASAGTRPATSPYARVGRMLRELGLAAPPHPPTPVTGESLAAASIRVTMGCIDDSACPAALKSLPVRDWALPDPAGLDDVAFRQVRDELLRRVARLREELSSAR
jgi:arsenate reductase